jgi:hypothetical protein
MGALSYEIALTVAEKQYYAAMHAFLEQEFWKGELACIGAGLGGGFKTTYEFHPLKYNEAMST